MAHERDRCPGDQDHRQRDPDDVGDQQDDQHPHDEDAEEDGEDPAVERPEDEVLQRFAGRAGVHAIAHDRLGQSVGELDGLGRHPQRQGSGEEPDHDPGCDLLDRVPGLQGLVAHHQDPGDDDQHPVAGEQDLPGVRPQLPDPRQRVGRGGGQQRLGQQVQKRVQRRGDDAPEERVDRVGDAAADVGDPAVGLAVVTVAGLLAGAGNGGRRRGRRLRDTALPRARGRSRCRRGRGKVADRQRRVRRARVAGRQRQRWCGRGLRGGRTAGRCGGADGEGAAEQDDQAQRQHHQRSASHHAQLPGPAACAGAPATGTPRARGRRREQFPVGAGGLRASLGGLV